MENKEQKKPIPGELEDDTMNAVSSGAGVTTYTCPKCGKVVPLGNCPYCGYQFVLVITQPWSH